ncbi:cag pathogenicity island protein, partial [Helicobacter pylori]
KKNARNYSRLKRKNF